MKTIVKTFLTQVCFCNKKVFNNYFTVTVIYVAGIKK